MNIVEETFEVKSFGKKFKELRKLTGLKQLHFADKGFTKNAISNYENGRRSVSKRDRIKLIGIIKKLTDVSFDVEYYSSSAEEELEKRVKEYGDVLYEEPELFELAISKVKELGMNSFIAELYFQKGKFFYKRNKYRESIREYMSALNYIKRSKSIRPLIYKSIANSFEKLDELSGCEIYLRMALDMNKTDETLRYSCLYGLAKVYVNLEEFDKCKLILDKLYEEFDEKRNTMYADLVNATLLNKTGNSKAAIEYSIEMLSKVPDEFRVYWLHNLARYYTEAKNYDQAIFYLNEVLTNETNHVLVSRLKNSLADIYVKMSQYKVAEELLMEIYDILIESQDTFYILRWYENAITIKESYNLYAETEKLMIDALTINREYSEIKVWYTDCIKDIIEKRNEKGVNLGEHTESIRRMMQYLI